MIKKYKIDGIELKVDTACNKLTSVRNRGAPVDLHIPSILLEGIRIEQLGEQVFAGNYKKVTFDDEIKINDKSLWKLRADTLVWPKFQKEIPSE